MYHKMLYPQKPTVNCRARGDGHGHGQYDRCPLNYDYNINSQFTRIPRNFTYTG
jgi:hypothetical protein